MNTPAQDYIKALYDSSTEPFVLGLTGFTGVGSSTTKEILRAEIKPDLPGYKAIHTARKSRQITRMDERVYKRLRYRWESTDWHAFVSIEISKIIFAFFLRALLNGSIPKDPRNKGIQGKLDDEEESLVGLKHFTPTQRSLTLAQATELIEAYEASKRIYTHFKEKYGKKELGDFIELLQDLGDQIRRFGKAIDPNKPPKIDPTQIFVLPRAMSQLIQAYEQVHQQRNFVIDAIKNPFEVEFLRRHYSKFYLIAILRDGVTRETTLLRKLDLESRKKIEKREKAEVFSKGQSLREHITSQDLDECLTKADMFIYNQESESRGFEHLRFGVIKMIALAQRPGCVTPTQDERCMQLAMTVRLGSGCISRQVGAIVIDKERRVIGVGWNDPPKGQVPCALRTCEELGNDATPEVFSSFERRQEFMAKIQSLPQQREPFCFRTQYGILREAKAAEYTRALHAEENALFQASRNVTTALLDSTLYTTASTCTLCAKKAYQLGVARIVYIDEYYDIAIPQTLQAGSRHETLRIERFSGIIGQAYHKLYTPPMPEKSIIDLFYREASALP
ncbi:MAG: hypothetical protein GY719_04910 [bacterium]|nr:hypothetical protein [bacterium]